MSASPAPRSFYVIETIAGYPIFLLVLSDVAIHAIPDHAGRPIGIAAVAFLAVLTWSTLRTNLKATLGADGSLTFKGLTGSTGTDVNQIQSMTVRNNGARGGATYFFNFPGGRAGLNGMAGRALAREVLARNPSVDCPPRWRQRR